MREGEEDMRKKIVSFLLALCLLVPWVPATAHAAQSNGVVGFSDISDADTAVSVEVLRMMGVLDGYGDGTYRPGNTLTRAQFCKMAVLAMGKGDQAAQYKNYTIFPDVKSSHWAAGYINLAVRGDQSTATSSGSTEEVPKGPQGIIAGFADGTFGPDRSVTYGQAVTILMRMLGYQDGDVGAVWPDGYLVSAASTGLTDGVNLTANAPVDRGRAARLFANLLATRMKGGGSTFGASVAASTVENVVLLSSSAVAADGSTGGLLVATPGSSTTQVYKPAEKAGTGLLNGRKGTVLLDRDGNALTFVPAGGTVTKTITVSLAKANALTDSKGQTYDVTADTVTYFQGEQKSYGELFTFLTGQSVTICFGADGKAEYIFAGSASSTTDAVVVAAKGSTAGFSQLAGGSNNYTIYKNGLKAGPGDLRQYDVAVYNPANHSIQVSDTRLTGALEDVYPNMEGPSKVTVMGHEFPVLPGAASDFARLRVGGSVTLLLTPDNQVAGAVESSAATRSNAVGLVTSINDTTATVTLLNGLVLQGNHGMGKEAGKYNGQLVKVASGGKGRISITRLSSGTSSSLNVVEKKLGSSPMAENLRVYEKVGSSALVPISFSQLTQETIRGEKISYVGYDWNDRVCILILNDVTGDCYTYGKVEVTPGEAIPGDPNDPMSGGFTSGSLTVRFGNGSEGTLGPITSNYGLNNGGYYGVAISADGQSVAAYVELQGLKNVPNSAWTTAGLVNVGGITYPVAENVVCYNRKTGSFTTLGAARAWSGTTNLYYDKTPDQGGKIRVIEVG